MTGETAEEKAFGQHFSASGAPDEWSSGSSTESTSGDRRAGVGSGAEKPPAGKAALRKRSRASSGPGSDGEDGPESAGGKGKGKAGKGKSNAGKGKGKTGKGKGKAGKGKGDKAGRDGELLDLGLLPAGETGAEAIRTLYQAISALSGNGNGEKAESASAPSSTGPRKRRRYRSSHVWVRGGTVPPAADGAMPTPMDVVAVRQATETDVMRHSASLAVPTAGELPQVNAPLTSLTDPMKRAAAADVVDHAVRQVYLKTDGLINTLTGSDARMLCNLQSTVMLSQTAHTILNDLQLVVEQFFRLPLPSLYAVPYARMMDAVAADSILADVDSAKKKAAT